VLISLSLLARKWIHLLRHAVAASPGKEMENFILTFKRPRMQLNILLQAA
jgi:hypothetical protein